MTGFGRSVFENENIEGSIEVSTVNKRNFDLFVSAPKDWVGVDQFLGKIARQFIQRGRVSISLRIKDKRSDKGFCSDTTKMSAALKNLREFSEKENIEFKPDAELLFRLAVSKLDSDEIPYWKLFETDIQKALEEAMVALNNMRVAEGEVLTAELKGFLGQLKDKVDEIKGFIPNVVPQHRGKLLERLKQAHLDLDLNDERILKEIALFADRCDISEEITRLHSHFKQLDESFKEDEAIGRKLEFIIQEINREINTTGSKANAYDISERVIQCKNLLESMREQVLNIE